MKKQAILLMILIITGLMMTGYNSVKVPSVGTPGAKSAPVIPATPTQEALPTYAPFPTPTALPPVSIDLQEKQEQISDSMDVAQSGDPAVIYQQLLAFFDNELNQVNFETTYQELREINAAFPILFTILSSFDFDPIRQGVDQFVNGTLDYANIETLRIALVEFIGADKRKTFAVPNALCYLEKTDDYHFTFCPDSSYTDLVFFEFKDNQILLSSSDDDHACVTENRSKLNQGLISLEFSEYCDHSPEFTLGIKADRQILSILVNQEEVFAFGADPKDSALIFRSVNNGSQTILKLIFDSGFSMSDKIIIPWQLEITNDGKTDSYSLMIFTDKKRISLMDSRGVPIISLTSLEPIGQEGITLFYQPTYLEAAIFFEPSTSSLVFTVGDEQRYTLYFAKENITIDTEIEDYEVEDAYGIYVNARKKKISFSVDGTEMASIRLIPGTRNFQLFSANKTEPIIMDEEYFINEFYPSFMMGLLDF